MFKKTAIAGLVATALGSGLAQAQAPASPHTLTGNVGLYSQYIFRGLTQTNREPAIQGGFDYSHSSGIYAGTWASNISWLSDSTYVSGGSGEFDFYGGFKGSIGKTDFGFDVGVLNYWYPGDPAPGLPKANTTELYGALSWKWITAKYSHSIDNKTFGVTDSSGTYYLDFTATFPVTDKLNLIGHYGIQKFKGHPFGQALSNDAIFSYEDWKLGLTYALPKDFTVGVFYTDTSGATAAGYGSVAEGGSYPHNIAKGTGTVFISKTF